MSDATTIEWTQATWNPTLGCDRVSPGCDGCYAITQARIRAANPHPKVAAAFEGLTHRTDGRIDWTGRINLLPDRLDQPLRWKKPRRIFVDSLSDLFHEAVPDEFIVRVFAVMAATPQHTYQILTKRHGRMRSVLTDLCRCGKGHTPSIHFRSGMAWAASKANPNRIPGLPDDAEHRVYFEAGWPLPNIWLGVSAEDQKRADLRIPALLDTPAAARWVSAEPLLGPIDLDQPRCGAHDRREVGTDVNGREWCDYCSADGFSGELTYGHWLDPLNGGLAWVVTGGESGPGARPAHPDWFRSIRDQCQAAGAAYLHKQHGAWVPESALLHRDTAPAAFLDVDGCFRPLVNGKPAAPPMSRGDAITVRCVGKKTAGRELDGRVWDEYPGGTP